MARSHVTDVVVVGAGPVGLFAVFECGMLKMRCHVVDALSEIGGQCTALYPEKPIYDIPGFPRVDAGEFVGRLIEQASPFAPTYHLGATAISLQEVDNGSLCVALSSGESILAKAVVIAAGGGAMGPNRPPLPEIERYEGRHVHYHVREPKLLAGKRVVIAGGGDSAVDWALALEGIAERVLLVHRRAKFRAAPASVDALHAAVGRGRIELVVPCQLQSIIGNGERLEAIEVVDDRGVSRRLEADALLALFGIATHLGPIAGWDLELEHQQIVVDPTTAATSRPGIHACGDIATYPHKLKLILTGFAEAAAAAHAIFPRVHPGEVLHFEHSTTTGLPVGC